MNGQIVLNTRPRGQAAELTRLLAGAGFTVVEAPAIQVIRAWDSADLSAARDGLRSGRFAWVILTSLNAGRALVADLLTARIATGSATATALGLTAEIALKQFSARAALDALRPHLKPGDRVLVPRGAEGRDELLEGLQALGVNVMAPMAYRTVAAEPFVLASELRGRHFDAITVCSPSALGALLTANLQPEIQAAALVCLGDTTALAAREAGLRVDAVASTTSMGALVDAVRTTLTPEAVA